MKAIKFFIRLLTSILIFPVWLLIILIAMCVVSVRWAFDSDNTSWTECFRYETGFKWKEIINIINPNEGN